ncbi:MAG: amino acid ABC transporter permease [Sarcina ventriculi]|nr:amino acid ABC transporter permease [Sarcina ventriculi]MDY7061980.1 amino acid ABC transporter permease [Sarcina ventriculi]
MDFSFLSDYYMYFIDGIKLTLFISLISVFLGTLFGIVLYAMKKSKFTILKINIFKVLSSAYIEVVRGTPLYLQIMIVYYGADQIFNLDMPAIASGILAISLNSAAYVSELIRAGIEAVDKGQLEAARSLGMNYSKAMLLVIIPQAIKNILPAIGNEFIAVIKESSMASTIGVAELMYAANKVTGRIFRSFEPLIISAICYFVLTYTLGRVIKYIERRMNTDALCK